MGCTKKHMSDVENEKWIPPKDFTMSVEPQNTLERANNIVKQRGEKYGHPYDNFEKTAKIWSIILGVEVRPDQVTLCMIGLKMVRLTETPHHQDSIDDIPGYAWCLDEVVKRTKEILKCDTEVSLTR